MNFEVVGDITEVETLAVGSSIRELPRLRRVYGAGRWRKRKGIARVRLEDDFPAMLRDDGNPASLEVRKAYQSLPDPVAASRGFVRVIDESGEDYLYPAEYLVAVELPEAASRVFAATEA
jgi:hypothetical protein